MAKNKKDMDVVKEGVAIEPLIQIVRGQKIILDADLARIYGVTTKRFNEQVKRNSERFPSDFMFQLTQEEVKDWLSLRSHFATSKKNDNRGGRRYLPYAFTEYGAVMVANVLNSESAVRMSIFVVRAFMKMRAILSERKDLIVELAALEKKLTERLDVHEVAIVDILRRMMELLDPPPAPPESPKRPIGFH